MLPTSGLHRHASSLSSFCNINLANSCFFTSIFLTLKFYYFMHSCFSILVRVHLKNEEDKCSHLPNLPWTPPLGLFFSGTKFNLNFSYDHFQSCRCAKHTTDQVLKCKICVGLGVLKNHSAFSHRP